MSKWEQAPEITSGRAKWEDAPEEMSWSEVPKKALKNLLPSFGNFAYNVTAPVHSPVQTAKGLGYLAAGVGSKIVGAADAASQAVGGPAIQDPAKKEYAEQGINSVGQFFKDRYGSVGGIKKTLANDPVGAMGDAAALLYGGGATLPGRVGQAAKTAGSVIDPVMNTARLAKGAATQVGRRSADVLGLTTGTGSTPIKTAYDAGVKNIDAFPDQMRPGGNMEDVVSMAESGLGEIVKKRSADYQANNTLKTAAGKQALDTRPIWDKITNSAGMGRFQGVVYNKDAVRVVDDITDLLKQFEKAPDGKSAMALDKLKQAVYQIESKEPPGSPSRNIAKDVRREIGDQIRKQLPAYDKQMKEYSKASDLIGEMRRTLSINEKATTDTTMRKLQSVMRNNVNTNWGARQKLVDELAKYEPNLPYALAGQAMSDTMPRGLARVNAGTAGVTAAATNPWALLLAPAFSPRAVGETAYAVGRGAGAGKNLASKSPMTAEQAARALLLSQLLGRSTQQVLE